MAKKKIDYELVLIIRRQRGVTGYWAEEKNEIRFKSTKEPIDILETCMIACDKIKK